MPHTATWLNATGVVAALVLGWLAAAPLQQQASRAEAEAAPRVAADAERVTMPSGEPALVDATGTRVPLRRYDRVAGASTVADALLLALAEPSRIVAFSAQSAERSPFAYRYAGKPTISDVRNVEEVLALKPDLVLVNNIGSPRKLARLREAGLTVFDLGGMHGMETLLPDARAVGRLVNRFDEADRWARAFRRRMDRVACGLAPAEHREAMYIGIHGDKLYGGTRGTSFHDVLEHAGLSDIAASRFHGWPRYTNEQLLQLDPEVVVTQRGMREALCNHPGLSRLQACRREGRVVEMDKDLIGDPGPAMLMATEALYRRIHGNEEL